MMPGGEDKEVENASQAANVNRSKILLAQRLNRDVKRVFKKWREGNLTLDELEWCTELWFLDNLTRETFLNVIRWARKNNKQIRVRRGNEIVTIDIDPLKSNAFESNYRKFLFSDFNDRFREQREVLSMMAWLVGPDDGLPSESRRRFVDV